MARHRIVLRADAGPTIGVGHVVRSQSLGRALVDTGCRVTLVVAELPERLANDAADAGIAVARSKPSEPAAMIETLRPDLVVVDGYHLGDVVRDLTRKSIPTCVIDDNGELPTADAAIVVNQNLHASSDLYPPGRASRKLLLGPKYVMLRSAVAAMSPHHRGDNAHTVLVSIGGADPLGLTASVVRALLRETLVDVWLAIGPANRRRAELVELAAHHRDRLRIDRGDLVNGYHNADVAVIGAGTTLWEVGYLGIPSIALIVADNQSAAAAAAAERDFVQTIDARDGQVEGVVPAVAALLSDTSRRRRMASAGRALFDNRGPERVASAIIEGVAAPS